MIKFFELGVMKINGKQLICEEINLSVSQELNQRHVSDQVTPIDLQPTKKKVEFTFKRPKLIDNDLFFWYLSTKSVFNFDLYVILESDAPKDDHSSDDPSPTIQHYMTLYDCQVSDVSFGGFDGTKPVTEEIKGQALYYVFDSSASAYSNSLGTNFKDDLT